MSATETQWDRDVNEWRGRSRPLAPIFTLRVYGTPAPAGSKRSFPFKKRDGKLGVSVTDDSTRSRPWKNAIAQAAGEEWSRLRPGVLIDLPMHVNFTFFVRRPKAHFTSKGELRPNAPRWPAKKPDVLKLARAVEDALTGVIWRDDCLIVSEYLVKIYGEQEGVEIEIAVSSP